MKKGKETTNLVLLIIATMTMLITLSIVAVAAPIGPGTVTDVSSERRTTPGYYQSATTDAYAGNVTSMNIDAITITNVWQGYYGNITGTIVLANSNNQTMYDWNIGTPTGEVFASNSSDITWGSIGCASEAQANSEEDGLGIAETDADGLNETFSNSTPHNQFTVASRTFTSGNCLATSLHNSTSDKQDNLFTNVLLSDGADIVYTALLNNDQLGFDSTTHDFQLIVAENGQAGDTTATTFYFWVEI
ncbi:hypothetical protein GOV05_04315 [Candidatus Woesearchaeota archaeon]|nr:hypothetical protein [Candidatus Woesearchaeota archaeon]